MWALVVEFTLSKFAAGKVQNLQLYLSQLSKVFFRDYNEQDKHRDIRSLKYCQMACASLP